MVGYIRVQDGLFFLIFFKNRHFGSIFKVLKSHEMGIMEEILPQEIFCKLIIVNLQSKNSNLIKPYPFRVGYRFWPFWPIFEAWLQFKKAFFPKIKPPFGLVPKSGCLKIYEIGRFCIWMFFLSLMKDPYFIAMKMKCTI